MQEQTIKYDLNKMIITIEKKFLILNMICTHNKDIKPLKAFIENIHYL